MESTAAAKPIELTDAGHAKRIRDAIVFLRQTTTDAAKVGLDVQLLASGAIYSEGSGQAVVNVRDFQLVINRPL